MGSVTLRTFVIALAVALGLTLCGCKEHDTKGCRCGKAYIAKDKTCHKCPCECPKCDGDCD